MAKELSMVERTKKGKEAREYFLECEKTVLASPLATIGKHQDLAVLHGILQVIAESREAVAQLAIQTTKNTAAIARIEAQEERKTIEEYVIGGRLQRKMPERLWSAYGKHLGQYCDANGIEAIPVPVDGKPWQVEKEYPLSAFHATFAAWLFSINGQVDL